MKGKFLLLTVLLAVWYGNMVNTQMGTLRQSRERIRIAQAQVDQGRLKAANSLLIQVDVDLAAVDKWYTLPYIKRQHQGLLRDLKVVRTRFRASVARVKNVMSQLKESKSVGFRKAEETIRKMLIISERDATLLSLVKYLDRLKAQDFRGADEKIVSVTPNLPDELNVAEIARTLTVFVQVERNANRRNQSRIAAAVKSRIDLTGARDASEWKPVLRGRAMIWDFTKGSIDRAYELLPDDLRASSRDGMVTMFCIAKRQNIERGRYSISDQPAYQEEMTVAVVYWPEKVTPGGAVVLGGEPPSSRPVKYAPEYGSAVKIKEWVASLPRR